ncbi:MAG: TetR/AcrR family transcriptional regulator [Acidimicrobiia bacterium]
MSEANRQAVLVAARRQFERLGYHGATLDSIAAEAGFSKGVVYSRFASKDDLFLAVLEANIEARHEDTARAFGGLGGPEDLARLVDAAFRQSTATLAWQAALLEFRVHAWRHPEVNGRYIALHERTVESVGGFLSGLYEQAGAEPPLPPRQLALGFLAGGSGIVTELLADPELEPIDLAAAISTFGQPLTRSPQEAPS